MTKFLSGLKVAWALPALGLGLALLAAGAGAQQAAAPPPAAAAASAAASGPAITTSVVVDSNPALFTVLTALNAAGYDAGLPAAGATVSPAARLRQQVRAKIAAETIPVLPALKSFYQAHHLKDPSQDLAQYVTLALFLGNPPALRLEVPVAGLPPQAATVAGFVTLVREFYNQADIATIWNGIQPQYQALLSRDAALTRSELSSVDTFFRMAGANLPRQFFIFPDAMVSPAQADALNYQENYYFVASLDLAPQLRQVRHTYLHFVLDPLIGEYSAVVDETGRQILPLVVGAPGLGQEFKSDARLFYTECLVRAVEIQLENAPAEQKQKEVEADMRQGLVMTQYWFNQLTAYRSDPANFAEFYPNAAFGERFDELAGQVHHIKFSAAPASETVEAAPPVQAPSLLEQANQRFDAHDLTNAAVLAQAELKKPDGDPADAWFLLAKVAAEQNQPQAAVDAFKKALAAAPASNTHVRTWSNIYLARLYDANQQRAQAVTYYRAALAAADTPSTKALAQAGIKAPFHPPAARQPAPAK